jgi:hypothetical protein
MEYIEHIKKNEPEMALKLELVAYFMVNGFNKGELMKALYTPEKYRKVDSAYPQPYADKIRELFPNFNKGNYCFDYNEMNFGELVNLNDSFIKYLFT